MNEQKRFDGPICVLEIKVFAKLRGKVVIYGDESLTKASCCE